ncbi:MAG: deoxyribodipyrimidine photo-lyase [Sediminispirochaetaceae bacterium]
MVQNERIQHLNGKAQADGDYVLYWMQQSQRAHCNHALEFAVLQANGMRKPLVVLFVLVDDFPEANQRHYRFMLQGLDDTAGRLHERGIQLLLVHGDIPDAVVEAGRRACLVVTDRGYLRIQRRWRGDIAGRLSCGCIQVESDVIVPVETASQKEEYTAGTFRPRIHRQLERFMLPLEEEEVIFPSLDIDPSSVSPRAVSLNAGTRADDEDLTAELEPRLKLDGTVPPVDWIRGGTSSAVSRLEDFIESRLEGFAGLRNDPGEEYFSDMSPYLHFGQISPLYIALQIGEAVSESAASYLEELIVRRELAMNFVFYNPDYDAYDCLPQWARKTLEEHEGDRRPYTYTLGQLERAETHDPYWNAAQKELVERGKMHGYMRMYWGKKILEWSSRTSVAFERALYLNNRYSIDGRDPNGFAGVAWCFGKHDRAWPERPVFGKVRYMNDRGLERKFDMKKYVKRVG